MITISLCMIVKNEERVISRCLDSVKDVVDEINIVDTGSTDTTMEILSKYTDRIYNFEWIDDFSAARNFSFQHATKKYILWLDADDVLYKTDQEKLLELKGNLDGTVDAVSMDYCVGIKPSGEAAASYKRFRLVKREKQFRWSGFVHEFLQVSGSLFHSDISVAHLPLTNDPMRNIMIFNKRLAEGKQFSARDIFYYANELREHGNLDKAKEYYIQFLKLSEANTHDKLYACCKIADSCLAQENLEAYLEWTLKALEYDLPNPEICCKMGYYFYKKERYIVAIHWYERALFNLKRAYVGVRIRDYETWVPHLQICVCYSRLGQYKMAYDHNEKAYNYNKQDQRILHNKQYLEGVLGKMGLLRDII